MKIVVTSQSEKKLDAVKKAFAHLEDIEIIGLKCPSGVNEQPFNEETLQGAHNRMHHAKKEIPDAGMYISIENGIFTEGRRFVDKAVVTLMTSKGKQVTSFSDGVDFPAEYVEMTRKKPGGFKEWTVGKTMAENGYVQDHADPHYDISGKSRAEFLNDAVSKAARALGKSQRSPGNIPVKRRSVF